MSSTPAEPKQCIDIEISDVGPVVEFRDSLPTPGMYVLRGPQESGKSTILRTVDFAINGRADGKLQRRDGTPNGHATIAGITLTISKSVRNSGVSLIDGLGDLDIGVLHRPKYQHPHVRDRYRIAALCRLADVETSPELFWDLVGGKDEFQRIVERDAIATDDLVEMSIGVKKCIEIEARAHEREFDNLNGQWQIAMSSVGGIDLTKPYDDAQLQRELHAAIAHLSVLQEGRRRGMDLRARATTARAELAVRQPVVSQQEHADAIDTAERARLTAAEKVAELKTALALAQAHLQSATELLARIIAQAREAASARDVLRLFEQDIANAEAVVVPTEDEILVAAAGVEVARAAVQMGAAVRGALVSQQSAGILMDRANAADAQAKRYRTIAGGVNEVLTAAIAKIPDCPLRIAYDVDGNARLVVSTARSEQEYFDELSDGAAWTYIISMLCDVPGTAVVLPQAAYGEIQPKNRALLDEMFAERGCFLLTAQVDDGPLRVERYSQQAETGIA